MMEEGQHSEQIAIGKARREAFVAAVPRELADVEDSLPALVRAMNAAPRSKIHRIYKIADELGEVRAPFVACKKGCASCCHMNVSLTRTEAERIAKATGKSMIDVRSTRVHKLDRFVGVPCPFLGADAGCSIYLHRPLSCRKHASFMPDSRSCDSSVVNTVQVPQVSFSGLDGALFAVDEGRGAVVADIRDFFPERA